MIKLQWIARPTLHRLDVPQFELVRLDTFDAIAGAWIGGAERTIGINSAHGHIAGELRSLSRHVSHLRAAIGQEVDRRSIALLGSHDIEFLPPDFSARRWVKVITTRRKQMKLAA